MIAAAFEQIFSNGHVEPPGCPDTPMQARREVVIGTDDRIRIRQTTGFPFRCIASLRIEAADGTFWSGTGWFASDWLVMTAGHCVYLPENGGWVRAIEVIPGCDGALRPFGAAIATRFSSVAGWVRGAEQAQDYGAIFLPLNAGLGVQGHLGFANLEASQLENLPVTVCGYPSDKPADTLWSHSQRIDQIGARTLGYGVDTAGGQSGAPVWSVVNGQPYVVGIHTTGHARGNGATRIIRPVFDMIMDWKWKAVRE